MSKVELWFGRKGSVTLHLLSNTLLKQTVTVFSGS